MFPYKADASSLMAQQNIEHLCHRIILLRLKACRISHPGFSDIQAQFLASRLPQMDSLRKLDIVNCPKLNPEGFMLLCDALSQTKVTHLSLEGVPIGDKSMQAITNLIRQKESSECKLKWLSLQNVNGDPIELSSWNEFLSVASRKLESLDVSRNALGKDQIIEISQGILCHQSPLNSLILSGNKINDEAIQVLCDAIKCNRSLQLLSLGDCGVTGTGIQALAQAMRQNCSLHRLYLFGNKWNKDESSTTEYNEVQYWLDLNANGRSFLHHSECRSEYLPRILEKVSENPHLLCGLLKEVPHIWI